MRQPEQRVIGLDAAVAWRDALQRYGRSLAVAQVELSGSTGISELLADVLLAMRMGADALLVVLSGVGAVREQARLLAGLRCVDAVVIVAPDAVAAALETLKADSERRIGEVDRAETGMHEIPREGNADTWGIV